MTILEHLTQKHTDRDSKRGWMCVSEKEWNIAWRKFGMMQEGVKKYRDGRQFSAKQSVTFRGCQLRVL